MASCKQRTSIVMCSIEVGTTLSRYDSDSRTVTFKGQQMTHNVIADLIHAYNRREVQTRWMNAVDAQNRPLADKMRIEATGADSLRAADPLLQPICGEAFTTGMKGFCSVGKRETVRIVVEFMTCARTRRG